MVDWLLTLGSWGITAAAWPLVARWADVPVASIIVGEAFALLMFWLSLRRR